MKTFNPHLKCALQVLAASLMPLTTACMAGAPDADNSGQLDGGADEFLMDKNGATNVALGGTATQSSIAYNGSPARAIDGNTSGRWGENSVTHTASTAAPWWRVNLGKAHRVDRVTLWNRTDCCSARLSNFHVDYLDAEGKVLVSKEHPGEAGPTTEIMLSARGVYAVRVQLHGANPLSLAEVQVWGAPDSGAVSNGLVGTYFDNADLTNQKATRVDSAVNFSWGTGSPTSAIANSTFSVRWTGFVRAQYSQTYTFYTLTDDGVRLWVNNQLIVNDWTNHPQKEYRGAIALQAGKAYSLKMEYYDNAGSAVAQLSWSSASQVKQIIPQAQLFTGDPSADQCPTDPNKTLPGLCGCGVSDGDSDLDGTPDCKDKCKTDRNKTDPGACGCGVPEGSCQSGFVSQMVSYDANGQLRYRTDSEGNRIPDFGYVGYKYGEQLPSTSNLVPANRIKTIGPIAGDNTAHIQSALDEVGAYPLQSNGYRGIVRLKPGTYLTHNPVYIRSSGVILQGAGRGADPTVNTIIKSSRSGKDETVFYLGNPSPHVGWTIPVVGSMRTVTSSGIPIGQRSFQVDDASPFRVGDMVVMSQALNDKWYSLVDLPRFYTAWNGTAPENKTWREHGVADLNVLFVRSITGISGNQITVDAPFYHQFLQSFGRIQFYKYNQSYNSTARLYDHIGIDNLHIDIETNGGFDEEHTERAIMVQGAVDSWARNITNLHASEGSVHIRKSTRITVENCESKEPVSLITGGRRYGFAVDSGGQQILIKDCVASENRHGFVLTTGSTVSGVVFLRGILEKNLETSEAGHQKWAMGVLFDNCQLTSSLRNWLPAFGAYNRGAWGTTSHGWSAANSVLWNVDAGPDNAIVVQKPPTAQNYAIGCSGRDVSGVGPFQADPGYIEGTGQGADLQIPSLYDAQLNDRR